MHNRQQAETTSSRKTVNPPIKATDRIQYGFKRVSLANLLEPDDHPSYPSRLRGDKWVQACLNPKLEPSVPEEIAFLFEVARGSMIYGMFFLPLASLAGEQCYRVLEAAARQRCEQLGLLKQKRGKTKVTPITHFVELVTALEKAGRIPKGDLDAWKCMVFSRNRVSHPASQTISSRQNVASVLAYHVELLNRLFN